MTPQQAVKEWNDLILPTDPKITHEELQYMWRTGIDWFKIYCGFTPNFEIDDCGYVKLLPPGI